MIFPPSLERRSRAAGRSLAAPAFSLIELLVSLGVIAVIMVLLLPAFQRTRGQAKTIECAGQLRQIGQGVLFYAMEHKGRLPAILSYGITTGDPCIRVMEPYLNAGASLWDCPAEPKLRKVGFTGYVQGNYKTIFFFGHPQSNQPPRTLTEIADLTDPNRRWLMADMDGWNYSNASVQAVAPKPRHSEGRNVLFNDGSVRWIHSTRNVWP